VRALEVYLLTGTPLTDHFEDTQSAIPGYAVRAIGVVVPRPVLRERVSARVDEQLARGVVREVEALIAGGVPDTAHAFSGLVYRQIMEMRRGLRGLADTRDLIVQENMRYVRRQLIWFRKERDVVWLDGGGESPAVQQQARALVEQFLHD
jgi:tRNA dimethylallyltransferase